MEAQTRKLFKVCAMRDIPIFTFINKMDREARDPFELCEELEHELGIDTYAVNWPIGCGKEFKGVYDRQNRKVIHFTSNTNARAATATEIEPDDPALAGLIGADKREQLMGEIELLDGASCDFDLERVRHGKLSPVFFGSALTNFGVEPFLEEFLRMTTSPLPRKAGDEVIDSFDPDFSAFVFKIQANMNKAHPGQHEQGPPGPHRLHAGGVRQVRGGPGGLPRPGEKEAPPLPAPAAHGRRAGDHRGGLRRGHHRRVRPGHLLHRGHPVRPGQEVPVRPHPHLRPRAL